METIKTFAITNNDSKTVDWKSRKRDSVNSANRLYQFQSQYSINFANKLIHRILQNECDSLL